MSSPASQSSAALPFDLKGSVFTLSVMHLHRLNLEDIGLRLDEKVSQAPQFFASMPVVLDLGSLSGTATATDFVGLITLLREKGLVPVAARRGTESAQAAAVEAGLAILSDAPGGSRAHPREVSPPRSHQPKHLIPRPPRR